MKRVMYYGALSLALCAALLAGRDRKSKNVTLGLAPQELTFDAAGGTKSFTISCNGDWRLVNGSGWCKADVTSGTGNRRVTVTAQPNTGLNERVANQTVVAGDKLEVLTVTQKGKEATLEFSVPELVFDKAADKKTFTVSCNSSWVIENGSDWCTTDFTSGTGNLQVTVAVKSYSGIGDRSAQLSVKSGNKVKLLPVTQKGRDAIVVEWKWYDVDATGDTLSVKLKPNTAISGVELPGFGSWLRCKKASGNTYAIFVSRNDAEENRDGFVVFSSGNERDTVHIRQYGKFAFGNAYTETVGGVSFKMIYVQAGRFTMGATSEQGLSNPDSDEYPTHTVTLTKDYYIGEYEVTQRLWYVVMGTTVEQQRAKSRYDYGLRGVGSNYPMYYVNWYEAQEFCTKLSQMTGKKYALPTEAQWEYAARGGRKSMGHKYSGGDVGWYDGNSKSEAYSSGAAHPVGQRKANELGIYDMSGNVWEWCQDKYSSSYYSVSPPDDPTGPSFGTGHVLRGGSWHYNANRCRVSNRSNFRHESRGSSNGFRIVLLP